MKQLKLDQTIRNLTFGDLEILLVVIGLAVTGLNILGEKSCTSWGKGRKGERSGGVISCAWSDLD